MIKKYVKRPIIVEAIQLTWGNWKEVCDFVGLGYEGEKGKAQGIYLSEEDGAELAFPNSSKILGLKLPGGQIIRQGDYIVRGTPEELWGCSALIFESTFKEWDGKEGLTLAEAIEYQKNYGPSLKQFQDRVKRMDSQDEHIPEITYDGSRETPLGEICWIPMPLGTTDRIIPRRFYKSALEKGYMRLTFNNQEECQRFCDKLNGSAMEGTQENCLT